MSQIAAVWRWRRLASQPQRTLTALLKPFLTEATGLPFWRIRPGIGFGDN
jgi:hypothetical protein